MTAAKYIRYETAAAQGWFSRSEWRRRKILIPDDAVPKDRVWRPLSRDAYPVFAEHQGTPILPKRQPKPGPDPRQVDLLKAIDLEVIGAMEF